MCRSFRTPQLIKSKSIFISCNQLCLKHLIKMTWHKPKKKKKTLNLLWNNSLCLQNKLKNKHIKPLLTPPFITPPRRSLTPAVPYGPYWTLTCVLLQAWPQPASSPRAEVLGAASGLSEMGLWRSLYRQARLSSLTSARRLLIMVAKKRAKRTLLISM